MENSQYAYGRLSVRVWVSCGAGRSHLGLDIQHGSLLVALPEELCYHQVRCLRRKHITIFVCTQGAQDRNEMVALW